MQIRSTSIEKKIGGFFHFLVLGAGRGGTSLLAGLLDYHTGLEVGFELYSIEFLMGKQLPVRGPSLLHTRASAFIAGCEREACRYPGKLYGNKITTEQLLGLEEHNTANPCAAVDTLDLFFNTYARNQKIIFLLRDGRTCVRSKMSRTGKSLPVACDLWRYSVSVYRFLRERHRNNLCIRYEELLLRPAEVLKRICSFLGVQYQEGMLAGSMNSKMLPEYQQQGIDRSKMEIGSISEECTVRLFDDLKYCGYL